MKKTKKKLKDKGEVCISCGASVAPGSGLYVNRIPADDGESIGFLCAECQGSECDVCGNPILDAYLVEHEITVTDAAGKTITTVEGEHVCDNCYEQISKWSKYRITEA